ncbi:2-hydroxychromene-2-carboxylate isomerase [Amylibacter marinus]|uniref:2-hydroxychromene-2-carboxylate isomerase n=1 Tax=Amylibacter marinus TaxID=1475483 RepID=A0ABQ5VXP8_9RHOB|nr:2-hydroxychromene-2-carboxylate isomerase [Amylibacter marinus]GLQ36067.1 2-hydroxychromene-2-carboxylate isomerase [Amylibacter marinus]
MAHIDYYFFPLSPFAYLAGNRLEEIAQKHGATITYKPMALMEVFAQTGGTPPAQRHISRKSYRAQELARVAKATNMPISETPAFWPTNAVPSCYAVIAAQRAGGGDLGGLCQSFLRACWVEDKDISQDDVIREALSANGFDPALADSDMLTSAQEFTQNTEDAVKNNVFGAPSYVINGQVFWGQDRLGYLDDYLAEL